MKSRKFTHEVVYIFANTRANMSLPVIELNLNLQGEYDAVAEAFTMLAYAILISGVLVAVCRCSWFNVVYHVDHVQQQRWRRPLAEAGATAPYGDIEMHEYPHRRGTI